MTIQWLALGLCGVMVGVTKTGMPGLGILITPLAAMALPANEAIGVVLPMLIVGDLFAVTYYRRHAVWKRLWPLLPWTTAGLILGFLVLHRVNDAQLRPIIGAIVLTMLGGGWWRAARATDDESIPAQWWFAAALGALAGLSTMLAHAAGPVMILYLLAMRLPKAEFIGTGAWFFVAVNLFKVPFYLYEGQITAATLLLDLKVAPAIALGAVAGIFLMKWIPEKAFNIAVQLLTLAAALKLLAGVRELF